jgi:hypothetical protein
MEKEITNEFERIKFVELRKSYPGICRYLDKIINGRTPDNLIMVLKSIRENDNYIIKLYTNDYEYSINFRPSRDYLGAGFSCRKTLPGENWHRGNDLPDGPANGSTMKKIIYSIISNELVKLS